MTYNRYVAMIAGAGFFLYQENPKLYKKATNLIPTTNFDLF